MKAVVRHEFGTPDVLKLEEIDKPAPGDDDLMVRVHAASLNLGDWEILTGDPLFITVLATLLGPRPRPIPSDKAGASGFRRLLEPKFKILGCDLAGRVEAVGRNVTQFQPGDEVFGMCMFGALAEYVCVPEKAPLVPKPAGMSFEQAAAIPQAAFIALKGLRDKGRVRPGQKVLINGAGGGAGSFAVQLAKMLGAEVTGVDKPKKLEMVRSIGADHVIDHTQEDFTRNGRRYDLILDLAAHRSVFHCLPSLAPKGTYLLAGGSFAPTLQAALLGPLISMMGSKKVVFLLAGEDRKDLNYMAELLEAGKVAPVLDGRYTLSETPEAFRQIGAGNSLGKLVITV